MMHFIDNEPEKGSRKFWIIIVAVAIVVLIFIAEVFVGFYLNIN